MYGTEIGTLDIQYQPSGHNVRPLWKLKGSHGYEWELLSAEIPVQESPIQIIVEGVRGNGHRGDMAIDDVTLIPGPCEKKGRDGSYSLIHLNLACTCGLVTLRQLYNIRGEDLLKQNRNIKCQCTLIPQM